MKIGHTDEKTKEKTPKEIPANRRYFPGVNCPVTFKNAEGATKTLQGKRTASGTLYVTHGDGWRNAEKYAKKMELELVR